MYRHYNGVHTGVKFLSGEQIDPRAFDFISLGFPYTYDTN